MVERVELRWSAAAAQLRPEFAQHRTYDLSRFVHELCLGEQKFLREISDE
jgi:hypothetical protein